MKETINVNLQKYLKRTIEASLINFQEEDRYYMLTDKGRVFLETYKEYSVSNQNIENQVNDLLTKKRYLEQLSLIKKNL